jgi:multidrug efflux pump subunit AcrA (membrane-fusion protein)
VRLGAEYDGKSTILEGLQAGDLVVTKGALQLRAILEAGSSS